MVRRSLHLVVAILISRGQVQAQDLNSGSASAAPALTEWLVLPRSGQYGRSPVHVDPLQHALAAGTFERPENGQAVPGSDGQARAWRTANVNDEGVVADPALSGGYAWTRVDLDEPRAVLLEAFGHRVVYVNGEPRGGNIYGTGWYRLPIRLRAGENMLLFQCRGDLRVRLLPMPSDALFNSDDATLPHVVVAEPGELWGGVPVLNGMDRWLRGAVIEAVVDGGEPVRTQVPAVAPGTLRKVGFKLRAPAATEPGQAALRLSLLRSATERAAPLHVVELDLPVRDAGENHNRTFVSDIDGSVQYYALVPASETAGEAGPALFLSLHGAAVEAAGQAGSYAAKDWGHIVAPTNRRPFGFDWEDWGRWDALEVLELVRSERQIDPERVYLTGHSMGGHGTWHIGVTFPDRFAAIAPMAGWISFFSYSQAEAFDDATAVESVLKRATAPSDTLGLSRNLAGLGVYVMHGSKDDNVPVREARRMREELARFHTDFAYYERAGAGHWWGVDFPILFDFLRHHRRPASESVRDIDFRTASPGVSAACHWVTVEMQEQPLVVSRVQLSFDARTGVLSGETNNVRRLSLDLAALAIEPAAGGAAADPPPSDRRAELDGQTLTLGPANDIGRRVLRRVEGSWQPGPTETPATLKGPRRYGPFKNVFRNRFVCVYGTGGDEREKAWALAKARFDAETFWYRGNGNVELVEDRGFRVADHVGRNVILYGNADTNAVWQPLLGDSPVQVRRGVVEVGDRVLRGDDLGVLLVRPITGDDRALVAAVAGTGLPGMRVTERLPYFVSGVAYPDVTVLRTAALLRGAKGVEVAGFFGEDWDIASGHFAWREDPE